MFKKITVFFQILKGWITKSVPPLGIEGQSVDELIAKYGDLQTAIKTITLEQLDTDISQAIKGAKTANILRLTVEITDIAVVRAMTRNPIGLAAIAAPRALKAPCVIQRENLGRYLMFWMNSMESGIALLQLKNTLPQLSLRKIQRPSGQ